MTLDTPTHEVWILGATGQSDRAIAARLATTAMSPVLVGRDATRLKEASESAGSGARTIMASSVASMITATVTGGNPTRHGAPRDPW